MCGFKTEHNLQILYLLGVGVDVSTRCLISCPWFLPGNIVSAVVSGAEVARSQDAGGGDRAHDS